MTVHRDKFSFIINQVDALISQTYFCMFRTVPLSIIRILFTLNSAVVYVIQVCRQPSSRTSRSCSKTIQFHPTPGSKRSSKLHKMHQNRCTAKNSCSSILLLVANDHHNCIKGTRVDVRLRTPDDGHKGCPKHVDS